LGKCDFSYTGTHRVQDVQKEFMALVPTDKVLEIVLDYLANDEQVREFVVYIQSEKFPPIHKVVENLKEYKDVSNFMCMFLEAHSDRENMFQFQLVTELLFSSVSNSSMIKVLTFTQSSMKFMTSLKSIHSNQQIPHARVSVFTDSLRMWLLFFPLKI